MPLLPVHLRPAAPILSSLPVYVLVLITPSGHTGKPDYEIQYTKSAAGSQSFQMILK